MTILAAMAMLATAAAAATHVPAQASLRPRPAPGPLDYTAGASGPLRPLNPTFVNSELGLSGLASPAPAASPLASALAAIAGPVVRSPVYHCVNGHQTEDPLSPPCVASFSGPNGGATYPGVSANEIRLLVVSPAPDPPSPSLGYPHLSTYYTSPFFDLGKPPQAGEGFLAAKLRLWQTYFNARYQTYGRRVHMFLHEIDPWDWLRGGPEEAREDVVFIRPFAVFYVVVNSLALGLAPHGIVSFDGLGKHPRSYFDRYPGLIYGYLPSVEHAADVYSSYVCQKLVHQPAALSGNAGDNGQPRRLGWMQIDGSNDPQGDAALQARIRRDIAACGGVISATTTSPRYICDSFERFNETPSQSAQLAADAATFKSRHITTVLGFACPSDLFATAANAIGYSPEWVLAGYPSMSLTNSPLQPLLASHHMIVIGFGTFSPGLTSSPCFKAQRQVDPSAQPDNPASVACLMYPGLRQVFSALQLAGPRLTPAAVLRGLRDAPVVRSTDPQVPSCSYASGDFTCLADAYVDWWDASGQDPGETIGCWRAMQAGARYSLGAWPPGNVDAQMRASDPCDLAVGP